jgi:hypothetical protein
MYWRPYSHGFERSAWRYTAAAPTRRRAAEYLAGGFVTYTPEQKCMALNFDAKLIDKYGAVSPEVADAMARGGGIRHQAWNVHHLFGVGCVHNKGAFSMKWVVPTLATMAFAAGTMFNAAHAAQDSQFVTTVPADALPISVYYNEDVYDAQNNKIGDVNDILLDKDGRVAAVIVGVGGVLGVGEKDGGRSLHYFEGYGEGQ